MPSPDTTPFPPGSAIVAYLRDSGGARQALSTEQQEIVVREWCEKSGCRLAAVYADRARPGGTTVGRDRFDEMINYLVRDGRRDKIAGVAFWDHSRWARDFDDGIETTAMLRRKGFAFHSMEEYIPPGSIGKVMQGMYFWASEEYKDQLSRNVKRGLDYYAQQHHAYQRPTVPPGYRKGPPIPVRPLNLNPELPADQQMRLVHRLEPDPETAPRVRQAFRMRAGGASIGEIDRATHLHKYRVNYQAMFRNELYIGNYVRKTGRIDGFCEPIIDLDTWDAVQEINRRWAAWRADADRRLAAEHAAPTHPRRQRSPFLLSGLARCAACGWTLNGHTANSHGRIYRYYRCGSNRGGATARCPALDIREDHLDTLILQTVAAYLTGDAYLQTILDALRAELASQPTAPDETARLRADLAKNDAARRRIVEAIKAVGHSQTLIDELAALENDAAMLGRLLQNAEAEQRRRAALLAGLDPIAAQRAALDAHTRLQSPDPRERQLALRTLIRSAAVQRAGRIITGSLTLLAPGANIEIALPLRLAY